MVVTCSGYATSAGTVNSVAIAGQTGSPGKALTWLEDYSTSAATTATLTFFFSRAVSNFTLTASYIDSRPGNLL
jgi:hypothetical protein